MKEKIILFGTGEFGKRAYEVLKKRYEIIAFVDNDKTKQNQKMYNIPIISPKQITELEFDYIYVTSMYALSITNQLRDDLNISFDKIDYIEMPEKKGFNKYLIPLVILSIAIVFIVVR